MKGERGMENKKENRIVLAMLIGTIVVSSMISTILFWMYVQSTGLVSVPLLILTIVVGTFCLYTFTRLIKFMSGFDAIDWLLNHMDIVGRK